MYYDCLYYFVKLLVPVTETEFTLCVTQFEFLCIIW